MKKSPWRSDYQILKYHPEYILIQDLNRGNRSVTNDAENVVADLLELLSNRKLYYIDSNGTIDQIRIINGKFAGFSPGGPSL